MRSCRLILIFGCPFLLTVGFLLLAIFRKIWLGHRAMQFVHQCSDQVTLESLMAQHSRRLSNLSHKEPTLIMALNQHALDMTINWLCNTQHMDDVHSRLLLVTLDEKADWYLALNWPKVRRLRLITPCLEQPFIYGAGSYQLFFVLRANLALALVQLGKPFWMIQQDTFWRMNLLALGLETINDSADLLFDRADADSRLIAGGHFFARPSAGSATFFAKLANDLSEHYTSDNAWMSSLCASPALAKCEFVSFHTITNWLWIHSSKTATAGKTILPALVQFDGDTRLASKLANMASLGFYFLKEADGQGRLECDPTAVKSAICMLSAKTVEKNGSGINGSDSSEAEAKEQNGRATAASSSAEIFSHWGRSYSQWQFAFYQSAVSLLYKHWATEWLLNHAILPYSHYLMLSV